MLTVNVFNLSLARANFGPSVTAIGHVGPVAATPAAASPNRLAVPWQDAQESPALHSLLSWHTRLSVFAGREDPMHELERWVKSPPAVSVRFVTGEGGVGKSRLAAEFATQLQSQGWSAGFVNLRKPLAFPLLREGTLLVVDYPEEHRAGVAELLRDLTNLGRVSRFRVLFLTRRRIQDWEDIVVDSHAAAFVDMQPVDLGQLRLDTAATHRLYNSALEMAATKFKTTPPPLSEEVVTAWLGQAPENGRALFLVALAVHSALHPNEEVVKFTSREVVEALVVRELERLRPIAADQGVTDHYAVARVLAMAAISDVIPVVRLRKLCQDPQLQVGFQTGADVEAILQHAGLLSVRAVHAPKPDIVAAAFVVAVLGKKPETAPALIWAALELEEDLTHNLERLARLNHDAEIVLGIHEHRIREWLAAAVDGQPERCYRILSQISGASIPSAWLDAGVTASRTLVGLSTEDSERGMLLNNLSVCLNAVGDAAGALQAIQEAVTIYRRLATAAPARYEPDLARSLGTLGVVLRTLKLRPQAIKAFKESIEILRQYVAQNPPTPLIGLLEHLEEELRNAEGVLWDVGK